jgi:hypothetical protein
LRALAVKSSNDSDEAMQTAETTPCEWPVAPLTSERNSPGVLSTTLQVTRYWMSCVRPMSGASPRPTVGRGLAPLSQPKASKPEA